MGTLPRRCLAGAAPAAVAAAASYPSSSPSPPHGCPPRPPTRVPLLAQSRWGSFAAAGEGRTLEHGYSGTQGGLQLPHLPAASAVGAWSDITAASHFRRFQPLLYDLFEAPGRPVNLVHRTTVLRRMTRDLSTLEHAGVPLGPETYTTFVEAMTRAGVAGSIVTGIPDKLHSQGLRPGARMYNALLQAHAAFGKAEEMWQVRRDMRRDNIPPDVHTYNAWLTCLLKRKDFEQVWVAYSAMKSEGIAPIDITFDKLIAACRGLDEGLHAMRMMRAEGIAEKPGHYVSLLSACRRAPDPQEATAEAEQAMQLTREAHLGPSEQHFDALTSVYKEAQDFEGVTKVMADRVSEGVTLTPLSFALYISVCAVKVRSPGDAYVVNAEKCFAFATSTAAKGYPKVYTEMLRVYVAAGDVPKAERLTDSLKGSLRRIREATSYLVLLLRLYTEAGLLQDAGDVEGDLVARLRGFGYSEEHIALTVHASPLQNARNVRGTAGSPAL